MQCFLKKSIMMMMMMMLLGLNGGWVWGIYLAGTEIEEGLT